MTTMTREKKRKLRERIPTKMIMNQQVVWMRDARQDDLLPISIRALKRGVEFYLPCPEPLGAGVRCAVAQPLTCYIGFP